jgi:pyridoxal phosphate enzyme (YggS family)
LPPLQVCLQVNISGEASKSGFAASEVLAVAQAVAALPRLRLRGLMAIPEPADDEAAQRLPHRALHTLLGQLNAAGLALDTLSMGMSADLEAAVAEGATIVRVGTAIFGGRTYPAA